MSDQQNPASPGQPFQSLPAPPTQSASHFIVAAAPAEVLITLGHTRMAPQQNGGAIPIVEWLTTLSMSPIAAKQLWDALGDSIQQYEKMFGKIPVDPNAKKTVQHSDATAKPPTP